MHIVWPVACPFCGRFGVPVCEECLRKTVDPPRTFCLECGNFEPCAVHPGGAYCFSASPYGSVTRDVVHAMKYEGGRDIARVMGKILASEQRPPAADILVPIPLHQGSERDFNQAMALARGAANIWGIPVADVLFWNGDLPRQATAPARADRALPHGAISMRSELSPGTRAFLVDDVYTTGNTMKEAKRALEDNGFIVVGAMVWSRGRN